MAVEVLQDAVVGQDLKLAGREKGRQEPIVIFGSRMLRIFLPAFPSDPDGARRSLRLLENAAEVPVGAALPAGG